MALIKTSGIISDIRGSIGGTIFQRTSAGLIARNKSTNINKSSSLQNSRRNITTRLQALWMELSNSQRIDWQNFIKYNPIKQKNISGRFINGQQTFLLINYYRIFYNETVLTSPVYFPYVHETVSIAFSNPIGSLRLTISDGTLNTTSYLILFCSMPVNESLNSVGNRLRMLRYILVPGSSQDISAEYEKIFGFSPGVGDKIFSKWSIADKTTGIVKPFQLEKFEIN